ncbi:MAG: tRNA-dihydrouridine synthase [Verrucomicrobiota bacterium]|jgi:tRNA-dihydrouridine synthase B|nr:tRNA-dihydrouridine synthase [Verrucomicrobiota bacterium]
MSISLQPLAIGPLRVEWPVFLAPMAGYTDAAFRSLCLEEGCGAVVTEMVNAYGLVVGHVRTEHYLDTWPMEHPIGAQIYGSDPAVMEEAAGRIAALGLFDFIDINAGCPMPKIRNRGDGAGLMKTPELLAEITRRVKAAAGPLPVTVKTRIGWDADSIHVLENTAGVEEAGADALFLHGRVAMARHSGPANWGLLAEVKRARRIPVIGNGGIRLPEDALRMVAETGVDGVMVGRAALGNPWWFRQLRWLAANRTPPLPSVEDVRTLIREHLDREVMLMERRGPKDLKLGVELTACLVLRAHLVRYLRGFRGIRTLAVHLEERQDKATLLGRIDEVLATGRRAGPSAAEPDA